MVNVPPGLRVTSIVVGGFAVEPSGMTVQLTRSWGLLMGMLLSPVSRVAAASVAGLLAARQDRDDEGALTAAVAIAEAMGETQRLVPLASAGAEAAWLAGQLPDVVAAVDRAWPAAVAQPHRWGLGELCWWLAVAGEPRPSPMPVAASCSPS